MSKSRTRPMPGPGREAEHEQWGKDMDKLSDPILDWFDSHPVPMVILLTIAICGLLVFLAAVAL